MPRIMIKGGIWTNVEVIDMETICFVDVFYATNYSLFRMKSLKQR